MWENGVHSVRYFDYPSIVSVDQNSPAQRAGIVPGDTLVAYDGVNVVNHLFNLTQMLTPDRKLAVTVRRGGENKDYSVIVGRAPVRMIVPSDGTRQEMPPIPGDPRVERVPRGSGGDGPRAGPVIVGGGFMRRR